MALSLFPLEIYERSVYKERLSQSRELIGHRDPDDVDLLALALDLGWPLWSNDADFEEIGGILPVYTTADLLSKLPL